MLSVLSVLSTDPAERTEQDLFPNWYLLYHMSNDIRGLCSSARVTFQYQRIVVSEILYISGELLLRISQVLALSFIRLKLKE